MKILTKQRLLLLLFFSYFFISSRFFPSFQLALFVPLIILLVDTSSYLRSGRTGLLLGLVIDLVSFSYPIGFYAVSFFLIALCVYRIKGSIAVYKPIPLIILMYVASISTMGLLMLFSAAIGRPLHYNAYRGIQDLLIAPIFDTLLASIAFLFIPFLVEQKFFIANILKSIKKKRHG